MFSTETSFIDPILRTLPENPGIYQFLDKEGQIIYVGKAKNLKKRVSSYFTRDSSLTGKVRVMVKKIADIRHIVVDTELDALLLENNLIKTYKPRYNILLKDDKSFPWICIKNEPFPRVFPTRNLVNDGSEYYGPYASGKIMHTLLDLIRQLYPIRTCNLKLTQENIRKGKFKVCLQYHIGNCLGPCENFQSEEDYMKNISSVREIIKGNLHTVKLRLQELMKEHAKNLEFEKAQIIKEKLETLERYRSKSTVVNPNISNVDVFSLVKSGALMYVNFIKVVDGAIIQSYTIEIQTRLDETENDVLEVAITEFRQRYASDAMEIIVPMRPDFEIPGVKFTVPKRGDKKQLLELSERNATFFRLERQKQRDLVDSERRTKRILNQIQKDLNLKELPERIECFDNSNTQGSNPVAAVVVFSNAKPDKKEYRHFNIRTVEGPDDFASMYEIVTRRYKRILDEEKPLPQLIIIDGGKGQLNAAYKSLSDLGIHHRMEIIGIAKRLEEIYKPGDPLPLFLDKKSETLKVIQHLRDEAHRFAITHHRKKREKSTIKTELTEIDGIGNVLADKLLSRFQSVKNIKNASLDELQQCVGKSKGEIVYRYFNEPEQ
ncbi:MAG: excinuclease ABC subunit UvrC [Bacteroidales bacterium]|jgi:excinuclease ABC subunit C|nr:excinuclease ABC subunit UvrC [Bacteroidales bacterium]